MKWRVMCCEIWSAARRHTLHHRGEKSAYGIDCKRVEEWPLRKGVHKSMEAKEIEEVKEIKEWKAGRRVGRLGGGVVDKSRPILPRITWIVNYPVSPTIYQFAIFFPKNASRRYPQIATPI